MTVVGYSPWASEHVTFEQVPFKRLMTPVERPLRGDEEIVTAFRDGEVTARSNRRETGYTEAADLSSYKRVEVGDLVVHGLDILAGAVGVSDSDGAMSAVCTTCVPTDGGDPRFLSYVIRTQARTGYTAACARGIRQRSADFRRWETLADLPIPAPPPEEQRRIADFLDAETDRIDTLIANASRQLELAEERLVAEAQAVLHIDGRGSFTPFPGACAPGFLPLWLTAQTFSGKTLQSESQRPDDTHTPYLKASNIGREDVNISDLDVMWASAEERSALKIQAGDVFVIEGGATAGKAAHLRAEPDELIILQNHVHCVRAVDGFSQRFIYWVLRAYYDSGWYPVVASAVTFGSFPAAKLRALPVPELDIGDQLALARHLDELLATVQVVRQRTARFNELLAERKNALITAAVTGQITV